jgi:hypothetical protein
MSTFKWVLAGIAIILLFIGIGFGTGYLNVGYTKTVGKAQQNANREVFEQTQSYVEGKRQDLTKNYVEWKKANDADKKTIEFYVQHTFANFDKTKLNDPALESWLTTVRGF